MARQYALDYLTNTNTKLLSAYAPGRCRLIDWTHEKNSPSSPFDGANCSPATSFSTTTTYLQRLNIAD
jgi:hypothetical protein